MVRWLRWHCPPDTGFEIRALAVWGRARYLSVTEAPHNTNFHTWMGKKYFCFFQTAETGNRTPNSGVKGSGANHYPRAPAQRLHEARPRRVVWLWEPEYDLYYTQWLPQVFWREFYQGKVGKGGGKCWASVVDLDCTHSKNNDPALGSCWSPVWGAVGTLNNNKAWLILPLHFLWYPLYCTKTSLQ